MKIRIILYIIIFLIIGLFYTYFEELEPNYIKNMKTRIIDESKLL
jgi:hypothetical protein